MHEYSLILFLTMFVFLTYSYSMYIILRGTVGIYRLSEDPKPSGGGGEEQPQSGDIPRDGGTSKGELIRQQLGERVTTIGSFASVQAESVDHNMSIVPPCMHAVVKLVNQLQKLAKEMIVDKRPPKIHRLICKTIFTTHDAVVNGLL